MQLIYLFRVPTAFTFRHNKKQYKMRRQEKLVDTCCHGGSWQDFEKPKICFSETDENIKRIEITKCYHWWIITVTIMHNLTMVNKVIRERIAGSKPHFHENLQISGCACNSEVTKMRRWTCDFPPVQGEHICLHK